MLSKKNNRLSDFILLFFLSVSILVSNFSGVYNQEYWMDHGIVFNGAYRIMNGQIPYRDFYIPTGPVVYYIQAFFNYIFGLNLIALAMHTTSMALVLCLYYYCILRRDLNKAVSLVLAYYLFMSFCGLINFPHHNLASFFFFLLSVLVLVDKPSTELSLKRTFFLIVLCLLSFFSKQDVGLLQTVLIGLYILLFSESKIKNSLYFLIILFTLFCISLNILLRIENVTYFFNLGQPPHDSRLDCIFSFNALKTILKSTQFYFIILSIFLWFHKDFLIKRRFIYLLLGINFITVLVSIPSGTSNQILIGNLPLSLFLSYKIFFDRYDKKTVLPFIFLSCICLLPITNSILQLAYSAYLGRNFTRIKGGTYSGSYLQKQKLEDLYKIKSIISKRKSFLNLSHYLFLDADFNNPPPKNIPIWFDYGTTLFDRELFQLIKYIKDKKPEIILLQHYPLLELREESVSEWLLLASLKKNGYTTIFKSNESETMSCILILKILNTTNLSS